MKKLIRHGILVFTALMALPAVASSECMARVADTQTQIEQTVTGELNPDRRAELIVLLLDMCRGREPGSSVVRGEDSTVYISKGLGELSQADSPRPLADELELKLGTRHYRD